MQQISTERVLDTLGGQVIDLEMSKKFKFDHTNKWYMHNPAFVRKMTHINSYGT